MGEKSSGEVTWGEKSCYPSVNFLPIIRARFVVKPEGVSTIFWTKPEGESIKTWVEETRGVVNPPPTNGALPIINVQIIYFLNKIYLLNSVSLSS